MASVSYPIFQSLASVIKEKAEVSQSVPLHILPYLVGKINLYSLQSDSFYSYYLSNNWSANVEFAGIPYINSGAFSSTDWNTHFSGITSLTMPVCSWIGNNAFTHSSSTGTPTLTYLSLPQCKSIGKNNFYQFYNLSEVHLSDIEHVGDYCFDYDSNASFFGGLDNCKYIGSYAFYRTKQSTILNLPVCSFIGNGAFLSTSVNSVTLGSYSGIVSGQFPFLIYLSASNVIGISSGSVPTQYYLPKLSYLFSTLLNKSYLTSFIAPTFVGNRYAYNKSFTNIAVWNYISRYDDYAFYNCSDSTAVAINYCGSNDFYVGSYAFYNFSGLKALSINGDINVTFNYAAITGAPSLSQLYISANNLYLSTNNDLNNISNIYLNVPSIGGRSYSTSSAAKSAVVSIGSKCTQIKACAFYNNISTIFNFDSNAQITEINNSAFFNCKLLSQFDGTHCLSLGMSAFYQTGLQSFSCSNISYINGCFQVCSSLIQISLPALTSIYDYTFMHDIMLSYFELPKGISLIAEGTFYNCTALTLKILNTETLVPLAGSRPLTGVPSVLVPASLYTQYQNDASWAQLFSGQLIAY